MHHKVNRLLPVLLILIVLCLVIVKVAEARRWVGSNIMRWTIDDEKVCRDGVVVWAVDTWSDFPPDDNSGISSYPHRVYARVYDTDSTFAEPPSYSWGDYAEAYGSRISTNQEFMLTYHTDEDGNFIPIDDPDMSEYYLYSEGILTWPRALPVGSKIMVVSLYYPGEMLEGVIKDCYLNRLTLPPGGAVIDNQHLYADTGIMDQSDAIFRLDALPAHGALWLNGSPLQVGDEFTQHDIDSGLLSYTHDFSNTTEDSFDYTLLATTRRLSTGPGNTDSNGVSNDSSLSPDGRFVTFSSMASNLTDTDANVYSDVFYHDLYTNQTQLISLSDIYAHGDGDSTNPVISRDGEWVLFESEASNLVTGDDLNNCGRLKDTNNVKDIFSYDLDDGLSRISIRSVDGTCNEANGESSQAAISYQYLSEETISFTSEANNLASLNDDNEASDIFYNSGSDFSFDPVSINKANQFGKADSSSPSIRLDAFSVQSTVAFQSHASNLLGDASDTNVLSDIFVGDGFSQLVRVSVSSGGAQANGHSIEPSVSASGRFVVFASWATNLAAGSDTNGKSDIFLRDRDTDDDGVFDEVGAVSTTLVSSALNGGAGNGASALAYITANGRYIVFTSWASDLVSGDSNGVGDVFVYDRQLEQMTRVSVGENGEQGDDGSFRPVISDDGNYVVFESDASNLTEDDHNEYRDVFVHYAGFSATFSLEILPSEKICIPIVMGSPNG